MDLFKHKVQEVLFVLVTSCCYRDRTEKQEKDMGKREEVADANRHGLSLEDGLGVDIRPTGRGAKAFRLLRDEYAVYVFNITVD